MKREIKKTDKLDWQDMANQGTHRVPVPFRGFNETCEGLSH